MAGKVRAFKILHLKTKKNHSNKIQKSIPTNPINSQCQNIGFSIQRVQMILFIFVFSMFLLLPVLSKSQQNEQSELSKFYEILNKYRKTKKNIPDSVINNYFSNNKIDTIFFDSINYVVRYRNPFLKALMENQWLYDSTGHSSAPWVPYNFYNQPNNQEIIGKNKLDWYGSGDVNNDEVINYEDYAQILSISSDRSDIDGNGTPSTPADKEILRQYLDGEIEHLPGHWNSLNREKKISWFEKCLEIDQTDTIEYVHPSFVCTDFSRNLLMNFSGYGNFENSEYFQKHKEIIENGRFNIPIFSLYITGNNLPGHAVNGAYIGEGREGDVFENMVEDYYYVEPMNDEKIDPFNHPRIQPYSEQHFVWDGYFGSLPDFGNYIESFKSLWLMDWSFNENHEISVYDIKEDILSFDPAKYDTITFEEVPENKLINYDENLDLSSELEEKVDTVYSKLPILVTNPQYVFTTANYENSEKIPLNEEYPDIHYKYIRKAIGETPWIKDSINWEIEVKDMEAPKINDFPEDEQINYSTSLDLENYITPENLEVTDNSGLEAILEKSTESTQTMDGTINQVNFDFYTDITATDKFDNDTTYTHKTEVRDTESPEGNLSNYYVQRNSGQNPEEAVKSLVENVYDNSELPVDTLIEQTGDKYYDVFLKDIAGNETYLGNVEADWAVGTGDEINNSGITVFPNPVKDILYISSSTMISKVVVTGTDGVYKQELHIHNSSVDISALEPGIYILELYNSQNEKLYSQQMVVQ